MLLQRQHYGKVEAAWGGGEQVRVKKLNLNKGASHLLKIVVKMNKILIQTQLPTF